MLYEDAAKFKWLVITTHVIAAYGQTQVWIQDLMIRRTEIIVTDKLDLAEFIYLFIYFSLG